MIRSILRSLAAAGALPVLVLAPATAVAGPAPDPACPVKPHPAGQAAYQLPGGALPRRYLLIVPSRYDGSAPLPVLFDFHGSGSRPEQELEISGMRAVAEEIGAHLVLPAARAPFAAGGHTWNAPPDAALPDDVRFVREVLDDVSRRVCVAPRAVFLTGFSGGGRFASELACAMPDRVAALAVVGGLRAPPGCDGAPVPVLAFHGTADPINPYGGGGPAYWRYGVDSAAAAWAHRNGCRTGPVEHRVVRGVVRLEADGCPARGEVVLYRMVDAGHVWPGSRLPLPGERFGRAVEHLDAAALIAEFFAAHAPAQAF